MSGADSTTATVYDIAPTILSRYASTTLFIFDILISITDEVEYVWKAKWTVPKVLYFISRYFGLAAAIFSCALNPVARSPESCSRYSIFNTTWLLLGSAIGDALLLLRVLALFADQQKTRLAVKIAYGVTYAIETAFLIYYLVHPSYAQPGSTAYAGNLGCVVTALTNNATKPTISDIILAIASVPIITFNALLVILVFKNILPAYRRNVAVGVYTPLYVALLRDGAMYFVLIAASGIFIIISPIVWYNRPDRNNAGVPWFMVLTPVAASRLYLNLRASAGKSREVTEFEEIEEEINFSIPRTETTLTDSRP
ncbi:hypothetical protein DACRYDRAFT_115731 [Dacryopinax primogenitus]|uniref:DUF6533 domain-containing protein n=1 Tax=Dacryopinax primogenitus (strain DJM 731) TaxID=1858805 RepID=M5FXJ3_DACPD|nr:uncharacterized protein DACRYDRAFT_115731 [Dacryopinax primogenitus]EJU02736.1 hypothetical protein DACRYDRAFT_115731 [Dacryopinax primogenitus]